MTATFLLYVNSGKCLLKLWKSSFLLLYGSKRCSGKQTYMRSIMSSGWGIDSYCMPGGAESALRKNKIFKSPGVCRGGGVMVTYLNWTMHKSLRGIQLQKATRLLRQFQSIKILFIFYFFEFPGSILENEACKLSTTVTVTRAFSTISHCGLDDKW